MTGDVCEGDSMRRRQSGNDDDQEERPAAGGGGVWNPKFCVPKMAQQDLPNGTMITLVWRGGGTSPSYGTRPF